MKNHQQKNYIIKLKEKMEAHISWYK